MALCLWLYPSLRVFPLTVLNVVMRCLLLTVSDLQQRLVLSLLFLWCASTVYLTVCPVISLIINHSCIFTWLKFNFRLRCVMLVGSECVVRLEYESRSYKIDLCWKVIKFWFSFFFFLYGCVHRDVHISGTLWYQIISLFLYMPFSYMCPPNSFGWLIAF